MSFEFSELSDECRDSSRFAITLKQQAAATLMEAAIEMRDRVQQQMPIDTGAAAAVWGAEVLTPISYLKFFKRGVWDVLEGGLQIDQGAERDRYNYIIRLNEGSSQQAPAGFIDAIAESTSNKYEVKLLDKAITIL